MIRLVQSFSMLRVALPYLKGDPSTLLILDKNVNYAQLAMD